MECQSNGIIAQPDTPVFHCFNTLRPMSMSKQGSETVLVPEIQLISGLKLKIAEPLARYTSMKIGGPADYLIEVQSNPALAELLPVLRRHDVPFCLLGNGSNVLVSDRGVRGAVIRLTGEFKRLEWHEKGDEILAKVGAALAVTQLVRAAAQRGYSGVEFAEGIPGSVGGALIMNAGAYGSEFEKVVDRVDGVTQDGRAIGFSRQEVHFSYRGTDLPQGMIVTGICLRLIKGQASDVSAKIRELVAKRKQSQPSGYPNSGSMFRNPPGDFAGRLIEAAGLKGKRIGRSEISRRHANFIINLGDGRAAEVRELMELAQREVRLRFGVELVPEVCLLGDWETKESEK